MSFLLTPSPEWTICVFGMNKGFSWENKKELPEQMSEKTGHLELLWAASDLLLDFVVNSRIFLFVCFRLSLKNTS